MTSRSDGAAALFVCLHFVCSLAVAAPWASLVGLTRKGKGLAVPPS